MPKPHTSGEPGVDNAHVRGRRERLQTGSPDNPTPEFWKELDVPTAEISEGEGEAHTSTAVEQVSTPPPSEPSGGKRGAGAGVAQQVEHSQRAGRNPESVRTGPEEGEVAGSSPVPPTPVPSSSRKQPPVKRGDAYWGLDDEPLPSVTTILKEAAKPALVSWAAREAAKRALADPSLSVEEAAAVIYEKGAANRGKAIHSWVEAVSQGSDVDALPPIWKGYGGAFAAWVSEWQPEFLFTELIVANLTHGYAGTVDAIVRDRSGNTVIIDYKTGKAIYQEYEYQLSAYQNAEKAFTTKRNELPFPQIDYAAVVLLKEDGTYVFHKVKDSFDVFLAYAHVYRRRNGVDCRPACPLEEGFQPVLVGRSATPLD